jgi:hypothetical protein
MIDSYKFGEIVIDGKRYTSDLIILPGRVREGWWRSEGHKLRPEDLKEVLAERPEVLVVGMGASGLMAVLPETKRLLDSQGVRLIAEDTSRACQTYNQLSGTQKVAAAFHLTC